MSFYLWFELLDPKMKVNVHIHIWSKFILGWRLQYSWSSGKCIKNKIQLVILFFTFHPKYCIIYQKHVTKFMTQERSYNKQGLVFLYQTDG